MTTDKKAWMIDNFFSQTDYEKIMSKINTFKYNDHWEWDGGAINRWIYSDKWVYNIMLTNLDRARKDFGSDTILPTYALLALYQDDNSGLPFHYDTNACTYSYDVCLHSKQPWPLVIDGEDFIPSANQAIAMYGEDQYHGRPPFDKGNVVLMLFLHYAEPDHWFFNYERDFNNR